MIGPIVTTAIAMRNDSDGRFARAIAVPDAAAPRFAAAIFRNCIFASMEYIMYCSV